MRSLCGGEDDDANNDYSNHNSTSSSLPSIQVQVVATASAFTNALVSKTKKKRKNSEQADESPQEEDENENENTDIFLSSMTWSNLLPHDVANRCDCDECGWGTTTGGGGGGGGIADDDGSFTTTTSATMTRTMIPESIATAIAEYKLQRPLRLQQSRSLLKRYGAVSVWEWTLPVSAEPLLEFGGSHRLVWIKHLPDQGILQSIGAGIVGSSAEENSRTTLKDWTLGAVVLVNSNGGRAVGYVHSTRNRNNRNDDMNKDKGSKSIIAVGGRYATLVIAKVPVDLLNNNNTTSASTTASEAAAPDWFLRVCDICRSLLLSKFSSSSSSSSRNNVDDADDPNNNEMTPSFVTVNKEEAEMVKLALA